MNRRCFIGGMTGTFATGAAGLGSNLDPLTTCDCAMLPAQAAVGTDVFQNVGSRVKVTNMKVFVVSISPTTDRPYVFVKLETDAGVVGWGDGTLEGKADVVACCINDLRPSLIGRDPMQVEHHWQSIYVHSFHRGGPVICAAISGIDEALWDIRGKILGLPVYKLLGGPNDRRGVRGYYVAGARSLDELHKLRDTAASQGITCFKGGLPGSSYEWIETNAKIDRAVRQIQMLREGLGPDIDIAIDFHAKTSPSVASVIVKAVQPLNLLFIEEPCPPENIKAMARISRRSTTPIATGERMVSHYACRELIEMGVVDILQTDINHVGGITGLWKVAMMAAPSGITIAPHACGGPIGMIASVHVDAAIPNFLVQECCGNVVPQERDKVWSEWFGFPVMRMVDGRYPLTDKPGLGFELSESVLKKYLFSGPRPLAGAYNDDGSVAEW